MRRLLATVLVAVTALAIAASPAGAAEPIEIEAAIGGRDVTTADSTEPIVIDPAEETPLELTVTNTGDVAEEIRFVRLEGTALGLTFLTYDLGIRTMLEPGEEASIDVALDFFDLDKQATGYLGTSLRVYDTERRLLGEQDFVVDVRGNATSTLGLFAIIVLGIAVFSVVVLVLNTLRRRLPSNRFVRGLQFAIAGAAIGVTLALGVSILRIAFADVEEWVPLVVLPTVIAFAIGYIAPGPLSQSIRDVREEEALQYVAEATVARASGIHMPATSGRYSRASLDRAIAYQDPDETDLAVGVDQERTGDPVDGEPVNETR
ncbi:MAG: hypothetical protein ACSLFO_00710 [Acidimicrobiales bacterium]